MMGTAATEVSETAEFHSIWHEGPALELTSTMSGIIDIL